MKTLTCILTVLLLLSAAPSSSEKKARRGSVTVHAWFYYPNAGAVMGICAFPIWMPQAHVWGDTSVSINCPSSSAVVDVTEGQTVSCTVAVGLKTNILASYPIVVDADNIGAGSIDLIIPR
ncbi:hypothetical protein HHL17_22315 [Chitinophaga sp. G-6-1-13]|uniref:Uncharacterized protein n=1 Tax=Chitinophaga fulva TaxID=2728842 RepID=A0A848GS68_9BACT|nr:hypothetical protein [Chitinophaga fulva]NML39952.1 hypothetical protein [Chitinophaga fulva]